MRTGLSLQQRMQQSLVMTPKLQQAIKVMTMTQLDLQQHIALELQLNPFLIDDLELDELEDIAQTELQELDSDDLEVPEPVDTEPEIRVEDFMDDSLPPFGDSTYGDDDEDDDRRADFAQELSFHDYLVDQLHLHHLPPDDLAVCELILGNINDDGFLVTPVEDLAEECQRDPDEVEEILLYVQTHLDPVGIAARDRREYFLLQIDANENPDPISRTIIDLYYDDLLKNQLPRIAKMLRDRGIADATSERVQEAKEWLAQLQLSPAHGFLEGFHGAFKYKTEARPITPDVVVDTQDHTLRVRATDDSIPRVHLNRRYLKLLENQERLTPAERKWLEDYRQRAKELIESIEERGKTIENVTREIFEVQQDFLDHGVRHLKPLVLRHIAERLGKHESTISRATRGKYVQTPRGIYELKFFFSSGLESDSGEMASSTSVRSLIEEMVRNEDPARPLSDQKISDLLAGQGYRVARRTVAKYREESGIAPSSHRKNRW